MALPIADNPPTRSIQMIYICIYKRGWQPLTLLLLHPLHNAIKLIYVHNAIQRVAPSRSSASARGHNFSFFFFFRCLHFILPAAPSKMQFPKMLRMLLPVHDDNDDDDVVRYKNSCYKYELQDKHKNRKLCYVAISLSLHLLSLCISPQRSRRRGLLRRFAVLLRIIK